MKVVIFDYSCLNDKKLLINKLNSKMITTNIQIVCFFIVCVLIKSNKT